MIQVLCTGGTFEKAYGQGKGVRNFSFPQFSVMDEIVARVGIENVKVHYSLDKAKDSLDMTDADRQYIADWCQNEAGKQAIVVHGTDTMIDSAQVVAKRNLDKVIIFTGALQPARMRDSDAEFNFGGALIAAQTCAPGVYIVMSGKVFHWNECQKNEETGYFEAK